MWSSTPTTVLLIYNWSKAAPSQSYVFIADDTVDLICKISTQKHGLPSPEDSDEPLPDPDSLIADFVALIFAGFFVAGLGLVGFGLFGSTSPFSVSI